MTSCQVKFQQITTNLYLIISEDNQKEPRIISFGIGHSDIRGLITYRSMVRRELYCLAAWITD